MQLVAYGAQDVYLTGQPKVTFFQAVYKRHTNFAMENIQQTVNGTATNSGRVSVTIARNGDLVGNMYVALPTSAGTQTLTSTNAAFDMCWVAERAIAAVELTIGGQRIDKHYQTWFRLYAECFLGESDKINYGKMTSSPAFTGDTSTNKTYVYLPLLFFFNRNPGLYLPLIALQYHEVRLDFDLTNYITSYFGASPTFEVWANYIYLDTEERRRFAQKGHEYLIEQVQHTGGDSLGSTASTVRLSFNHPVKELVWCYQNGTTTQNSNLNAMWNFTTSSANVQVTCNTALVLSQSAVLPHLLGAPMLTSNISFLQSISTAPGGTSTLAQTSNAVSSGGWVEEGSAVYSGTTGIVTSGVEVGPLQNFKVILNGQDRFKEQLGKYFNQYQPYVYHTGTPYPGIYVYSFALQPEEHQPTGTCNFSRIDNAQVAINMKSIAVNSLQKMFAVNYNSLRIQSSMGGLAFSN
jgi:hypothetical protein